MVTILKLNPLMKKSFSKGWKIAYHIVLMNLHSFNELSHSFNDFSLPLQYRESSVSVKNNQTEKKKK